MLFSLNHRPNPGERSAARFRRLDAFVGVPLCFVLSVGRRLWPARRLPTTPPRRLLMIKLSENGSVVLLGPLFRRVKSFWPRTELFFLTFEENRTLLELMGEVPPDHILTLDPSSPWAMARSTLDAVRRLRELRMDAAFDLELFSRVSTLLSFVIGAPRRVGFHRFHLEGLYRGDLATHRLAYSPYLHTAAAFESFAHALEADPEELPLLKQPASAEELTAPRFEPRPAVLARIRRKLATQLGEEPGGRPIFVLNPNASALIPIRKWPVERYEKLGRVLLERPENIVVTIGKGEDALEARRLSRALGSVRCIDLTDQTDLEELLSLLHLATALITNDSGPAHFASMVDLPTVVLFGPETPELYRPLGQAHRALYAGYTCSPCVSAYNHRRTACERARCLEALEVEQVLEALRSLGIQAQPPLRRVVG